MKKSLREWYKYLTEEEKHNILLLSKKCSKDIDGTICYSLADAIMESGDWDKGLNTSTLYFHALYNKYLHKSLEEIMQMNNYYVNLNLLIKETLNNI